MHKMKLRFSLFFCSMLYMLHQAESFAERTGYIVYMGSHGHLPLNVRRPVITMEDQKSATNKHYEFLSSFVGSPEEAEEAMTYSYNMHINGFSAMLNESTAKVIAAHPGVVSVFPSKQRKLDTTYSMNFLSLELKAPNSNNKYIPGELWRRARHGSNIILANLDSGVWPESESFRDDGYESVPSRWKGSCQSNSVDPVTCNNKLIGAHYFNEGYLRFLERKNIENTERATPRDYIGHGTHTLSTAGGNFVAGANVFGLGKGTAKGSAPHARLASYKVCWDEGCNEEDILKACDQAIFDGVHVLSLSIGAKGNATDFYLDPVAICAFHAVKHDVVVVASAGNQGPAPESVKNVAPWMLTVAASTMDREFYTVAMLENGLRLQGVSLSPPLPQKYYQLINAIEAKSAHATARNASLCIAGSLRTNKVKGKILVCQGGENEPKNKGQVAYHASAAGMHHYFITYEPNNQ